MLAAQHSIKDMELTATAAQISPDTGMFRRWFAVAALSFATVVSYVDRQIINLLVEPIKSDLQLTDLEISLLQGFSFALFYALLAIPLAWIADRSNRKWVMMGGLVCWSAATFSSGLATSFAMLFAARMMVGIGEATLAPAGFSMLSDAFPSGQSTVAISVFTGSGFIGSGLALIIGAAIIAPLNAMGEISLPFGVFQPWQATFMAVTLLSIPAFLLLLLVVEPPRREGNRILTADDTPPALEVFSFLRRNWRVFVPLVFGLSLFVAAQFGIGAWSPSHFIRNYGMTAERVGYVLGPMVMLAGLSGVVAGGFTVRHFMARGVRDASLRIAMAAIFLAIPFAILFPLAATPEQSVALLSIVIFLGNLPVGSTVATFPLITPNRMRAQVLSIYLLVANLLGYSAGPTLVAWITDHLYRDPKAVGLSLAIASPAVMIAGLLLMAIAIRPYRQLAEAQHTKRSEYSFAVS